MSATPDDAKRKTRVIIVDDNEDVRTPIMLGLELAGYEVAESGNGENAIVQTTEFKPDFAIVDYGLPDINGLEVGQQMNEATDSHIVLGLLTGSDGRELRSEADRIGFHGFFVKPISIREICKWISENSG